jgi:lysophospholipase L1-like esterase
MKKQLFIKKILSGLLISLVGITGGLILVECTVRILQIKGVSLPSWNDRPVFYFKDPKSQTLQDYNYDKKKPKDVYRIAVIGDSYSYAPYMQFSDSFPKVLERMLNLESKKKRAEIINFGVPGYSSNHEIGSLKEALTYNPDLILLQITLNDPEIKPYTPTGIRYFDTFGQIKIEGWKAKVVEYWKTLGVVLTRLHNKQTQEAYKNYFIDLFENKRTWSNFSLSIEEMVAIAKSKKIPFVAQIFPLFGLPLDESYPFFLCHKKTSELLQKLSVPYQDLFDLYKGIPLERLQVIPKIDRHPNEIAHRMAGESIYTWLLKQNLIPNELRISQRYKGRTQLIKEEPYIDS